MGCAVTKQDEQRRKRRDEERKMNQYWYDREEHLITVHEPSSILDPADLRTDLPHSKEQQAILRGAMALSDIHVQTVRGQDEPLHMPDKAAKVLLDLDAVRRDSGIDIDSCVEEDDDDDDDEGEQHREGTRQSAESDSSDGLTLHSLCPSSGSSTS